MHMIVEEDSQELSPKLSKIDKKIDYVIKE